MERIEIPYELKNLIIQNLPLSEKNSVMKMFGLYVLEVKINNKIFKENKKDVKYKFLYDCLLKVLSNMLSIDSVNAEQIIINSNKKAHYIVVDGASYNINKELFGFLKYVISTLKVQNDVIFNLYFYEEAKEKFYDKEFIGDVNIE